MQADIAEQALEGLVPVSQYRGLEAAHAVVPSADVLSEDGACAGQILFGEAFDILFRRGGRAYGRVRRDGVIGWVAEEALKSGAPRPAYRVASLDAELPFNALVQGDEGVEADQLAPIGSFEANPADVAERFVGLPVVEGQRSSQAVDAVGLIQQALFACGLAAPRKVSELAKLGRTVSVKQARRGDVVIWQTEQSAHVAIMVDSDHLVHASDQTRTVQREQLADVAAGLSAQGLGAPTLRRVLL